MLSVACVLLVLVGCNHVQPHLKVPDLRTTEPALRATLVGYTGGAVVGGNRVDVLLNGEEIFPAKLEVIRAARKTITYAPYVFEEGAPAAETAQALAERCRAGVKVHVLLDAVGSLMMPTQYRDQMTEAGCEVATYRPVTPWTLDRANYRNHRRILVADGRVGVTGGSGTSGKWSGNGQQEGQWRDTDMRVEGPVVNQLQGAFAENWLEATGAALGGADYFPWPIEAKGAVESQIVRSSPAGGSVAMYTMFLLAMASARRTIYITNPYFVPDDKMTDPNWAERSGPFSGFIGVRRYTPPGIAFDDLPPIDFVVISHDHYDHLDESTVRRLARTFDPLFVVPLGIKGWLADRGITNAVELDWGESVAVKGLTIVCTPAQHGGGRTAIDQGRRLWSSWAVLGSKRFYFGGDTGYFRHFAETGDRLGPFDLAVLPIGSYTPREIAKPVHITPEEALQAALDLRASHVLGVHWGTFALAREPYDEPPARMRAEVERRGIDPATAWILKPGETRTW